ncbi:MAG: D-alanyl-D-alanine carboxypeptidase/D-alanyl-D-alanine-endopeptidase [Salinibacterium sp.]|nr:MAG: D-alanyl-D-alanine carboxypeptidase/D-alanyl-D-alanine-endopeptidase [Salinibacterium sp.]
MAFLLLGTGAVFAGVGVGISSLPTPTASTAARSKPISIPEATRLRTCSVQSIMADPRLKNLYVSAINADTSEVLIDHRGTEAASTGSVLKVLTAAAALNVIGKDTRLSTRVVDGSLPGTIVLVGGGDPTLATTSNGFYTGAPRIADLATAAMAKYNTIHPGVPITTIVLDSTLWSPGDNWDSSWLRKEQINGYHAEVTALMVDGGRANPALSVSRRSSDPIGDAGRAFAAAAGLSGVTFTSGAAVGGTQLAEVKSQPLSALIKQMLQTSDNILAENLARIVSKKTGFDGSSTSLASAIPAALVEYGLDNSGLKIRDGSGLSALNAVPPQYVAQLMIKIKNGEKNLDIIYSSLPVAGQTGTLAGRFVGANAVARGKVIAKTGWLDAEYSLAGIVNAEDGSTIAFAFYSIRGGISADAKEAQDTLATALYRCGDNLSNN